MKTNAPCHILIIEDSPDDRGDIRWMLLRGSDRHYRFTEAGLGAAAVRACRETAGALPDCVLLDYFLPDMNAMEVLTELRGGSELPPCPVVVLTGSDVRVGRDVLRAGAQDYIGKSWSTPESLTRAIENAIERFELITERSCAERKLRENDERIRLAARVSGFGIHDYEVAADRCTWSPELFALTGVPRDALIRLETAISLIHPEDRERVIRAMQATLAPGGTGEFSDEFRVCRADTGETRWFYNRSQTVFDGSNGERIPVRNTGIVIDITGRKLAEEVLRESEAKAKARADELSAVMEAVPAITFLAHDPSCRSMSCSQATRQFLRLPEGVSSSKSAPDGEKPTHFQVIKDGRELVPEELPVQMAAATGRDVRDFALTIMFNDGTARDLFGDAVPLFDESGNVRGAVGAFMDTTDRNRAEEALIEARKVAEAANQNKDRFLAVLSHELRTPLMPMLMVSAALEHDSDLRPAVREQLAMIKRNIQLMTKLIDDLLDLSRITSGKVELDIESVDLNQTVRDVSESYRLQIQEKSIRFETELHDVPSLITADSARLQQVLRNLLQNAVKFTPEKGAIRVTTVLQAGGRWELRVQDTGVGISAEALPHIFDAFEQGGVKVTRQYGGLGLGLSICKALVELHGGSIRAESAGPTRGSTFIIELPGQAPDTAQKAPVSAAAQSGKRPPLRVLLVEDHLDTAQTISHLLRSAGFTVTTASDLASASATVEGEPFDVVICDLGLPDGDGYELMRRIRAIRSVPGIAMSGYAMSEDRQRSQEAGFSEHLVKPIDILQLIAALRRVTDNWG